MTDISNQVKWFKVFQDLATDLKAEVALAAASEIIAKQSTAADLKALVTLAGLRGIIPNPITATRVDISFLNISNATTIHYTVPAAKVLFISSAWFNVGNSAVTVNFGYLGIRNVADVLVNYILAETVTAIGTTGNSNRYKPAIEVPAGFDVFSSSATATIFIGGGFHGWLEDV